MKIKKCYQRFKEWKRNPRPKYKVDTQKHTCCNCGHEFEGTYCPVCGQKGVVGAVDWKSVGYDLMKAFGKESESLFSSILQLFGRPGYLINDYINGKRKICYSPVNMLFVLAVGAFLILKLFNIDWAAELGEVNSEVLAKAVAWLQANMALGYLILSAFLIFPTWLMFRYSPRNPHHSFPQGIYIQIFMCSLTVLFIFLSYFVDWMVLAIPFYYCIAYKQLFGYSIWGTLWRTFICMVLTFFVLLFLIVIVERIVSKSISVTDLALYIIVFLVLIGGAWIILYLFSLIGKYTASRRELRSKAASKSVNG